MNIYTNKLVIFTIVTAVIINVMPSYSTGSVFLAPPQGSDVSSLLAHSNEDNNSAQFLQDRIEIFQDERRLSSVGYEPNLIDTNSAKEVINGFFLKNKCGNTKNILWSLMDRNIKISDIEKITAREFQLGRYMTIFKVTIQTKNEDVCEFTLNIAVKIGEVNELAVNDYNNLKLYNEKHPDVVVKPLIFDSMNTSGSESSSHNVFALEWLGDYVELNPYGKRFILNPTGREEDEVGKYQIRPEEENHSNILSEIVKLLVQMVEYYPHEEKIDYIHNFSAAAGDFMFKPGNNGEFDLRLITIRTIKKKGDVADFLDILLSSMFVEMTGKKDTNIKSIFKGIGQGLITKYGKNRGMEIYMKWIDEYKIILEERERKLRGLIDSGGSNISKNIGDEITMWLKKHSGERELTDNRFTKEEREIIRRYLDSGKKHGVFMEIMNRQMVLMRYVLNNIGSAVTDEIIKGFEAVNKVALFEPILNQITSNRIDTRLAKRVQLAKKMHPTYKSIGKRNERDVEIMIGDDDSAVGIAKKDGICELGIAEELIPKKLELYAVVSDPAVFGGKIRTARVAGTVITSYLKKTFNPGSGTKTPKLTEKFIIRHLVAAIDKANEALLNDSNLGEVCVSAAFVWYLADGSKRIITINQGNNQVYLKEGGRMQSLAIKNIYEGLKNNVSIIGNRKYVFVDLHRLSRRDLMGLFDEQSKMAGYCAYIGQPDEFWNKFIVRMAANNTVGSKAMLPVVYKKDIPKGSSAKLIIASKGVADVLTQDEIGGISTAKEMVEKSHMRSSSFLELGSLGLFKYGEEKLKVFLENYREEIIKILKSDDDKFADIEEAVEHLGSVMVDVLSMPELYRVDRFMGKLEESGFEIPDEIVDELNIMHEILSRPNVVRAYDEADSTVLIAEIPKNIRKSDTAVDSRNMKNASPEEVGSRSAAFSDTSQ